MKVHVLLAASLLVCACSARHAQPHHQTIVADAPDPSPQTYALGATVTADGAVPKDAALDAFPRGRDVFLSIDVRGAHVDQTIEVTWIDPSGRMTRKETRNVPVGAHYAAFAATPSAAGEHRAVVVINGRVVSEQTFRVL